jgi:flavin-dependent dehydrogenase
MRNLIVGGGPAGSYLAYILASRGEEVRLYEKNARQAWNPKACSGGIAKWWVERTRVPLHQDLIADTIDKVVIKYGDAELWSSEGSGFGYILRRGAFERSLQEDAAAMGADVRYYPIFDVSGGYDRIFIAEGAAGTVKKSLGMDEPRDIDDFHMGVQYIGRGPEPEAHTIEVYADDLVPGGYAWRFPTVIPGTRDSAIEVGLGVPLSMGSDAWHILDKWMEKMGWHVEPAIKQGHIIPTNRPQRQHFRRNGKDFFVLGDSAYLTNPVTGGGIHAALLSALYASEGKPVPYSFRVQTRILYRVKQKMLTIKASEAAEIIRKIGANIKYDGGPPYAKLISASRLMNLIGLVV